jgi:hypothetical protein
MQHITIYRQEGRFAGWPANYGIWSWDDEIVVGFTLGYLKGESGFHARDKDRPFVAMQARSLDGGQTSSGPRMEELFKHMDIIESEAGKGHGYLNWQGVLNSPFNLRG